MGRIYAFFHAPDEVCLSRHQPSGSALPLEEERIFAFVLAFGHGLMSGVGGIYECTKPSKMTSCAPQLLSFWKLQRKYVEKFVFPGAKMLARSSHAACAPVRPCLVWCRLASSCGICAIADFLCDRARGAFSEIHAWYQEALILESSH